MSLRKRITLIVIAALVVSVIAYGFLPQPIAVNTATVSPGALRIVVEEDGKTRVVDRYVIAAPVAGYAERVELDVGDAVQAGDVVVQLQPLRSEVLDPRRRAEAKARVARAEAALRAAQNRASAAAAGTDFAQLELDRAERLHARAMVSKERFDQAKAEADRTRETLRSARAEIDVARYELEAAQTALEYSGAAADAGREERVTVTTPITGQVLEVYHESEGPVTVGTPLVTVGDPERLEIEVDLLSEDAVRVQPGMRVLLKRWGGETPLEGTVARVEPVGFTKTSALGVEEQRVWVIVGIVSPSQTWSRLGHGYRVEAEFILWDGSDVLSVPSSALYRSDGGWAAFVVRDGRAHAQPVTIGRSNGLAAEVLHGLQAGDVVITHPSDAVAENVRVRVRAETR